MRAAPPVYIVVRQTLDWADARLVDAQIVPKFRPKYELWNATLSIPYPSFRQRLKEIARDSLERVRGAEITTLDRVPVNALCVPIDDDDWFAPDLVEQIRDVRPEACGYVWRRWELQVERPLKQFESHSRTAALRATHRRNARRYLFGSRKHTVA
jgi:hypothetical protein